MRSARAALALFLALGCAAGSQNSAREKPAEKPPPADAAAPAPAAPASPAAPRPMTAAEAAEKAHQDWIRSRG
jgi:hypothetical protein